jgi:CRISPR/Cas system CSM-associated protein Csm3 (group 7 of RAMP superfamily)
MARNLHSRWHISGKMITTSPLSVGGMSDGAIVDLALAVNGQGNYYIPGTSLAGALRNWMSRNYDSKIADSIFGCIESSQGNDDGYASFITVADIPIQQDNLYFEVRDGVGIDRDLGTAVDNFKYDRAVLPKGTELNISLTLERQDKISDDTWQSSEQAIAHLLEALKTGKIPIGAAKTRGLGRIKLIGADLGKNWDIQTHDFQTRKGILAALGYQSDAAKLEDAPQPFDYKASTNSSQSTNLAIAIAWHPVEPVMVKAESEGIAVDILPLTSANGSSLTFVLPGSSIKGSLRTQAERIVRTVLGIGIVNDNNPYVQQKYPTQIDVPLIGELFGKAAKIENGKQQGCIGALSVIDCYANLAIAPQAWANIESATTESQLRTSLGAVKDLSKTKQVMHVAIDRWTGGAADQMLYSTLEPIGFDWEPIVLELNLSSKSIPKYEAIALVLLVLRDMMLSKIPLGYATNRGMGAIAVDSIEITGTGLAPELTALADVTLENSNLNPLSPELLNTLTASWTTWIKKEKVQGGTAS